MATKRKPDLKVVILGAAQVGKTSLIQRYLNGTFSNTVAVRARATIGASFFLKQWDTFHAAIWDTAGEEKYQALQSFYCRNAAAAILAYDITDHNSLRLLREQYLPLLSAADGDCLCVVVGCKADLVSDDGNRRAINKSAGKALAKEQNSSRRAHPPTLSGESTASWDCAFFETSAKTGHNVEEVFEFIREVCLAGRTPQPDTMSSIRQPTTSVGQQTPGVPVKSGCC